MSSRLTDDARPPSRGEEGMGGLAKGLAIIEAFSASEALTISDAARHATISRAAARRCLLTLQALGYVEQVGQLYRPREKLRQLGLARSPRDRLALLAQPFLDAARDRLDEAVSLACLDGDQSLFVARAEAAHIVSIGVKIGARLPVYCSATGRVLLSDRTDAAIRAILRRHEMAPRTINTRTELNAVASAIADVRTRGYSLNDEELEIGMRSLAVPVPGDAGIVLAAVSVSTASSRAKLADFKRRCLPVLLDTAGAIAGEARRQSIRHLTEASQTS